MADNYYYLSAQGISGQSGKNIGLPQDWIKVKLYDIGDGTFSMGVQDLPAKFANITGAGTALIKSGAGVLKSIIINKAVAASVTTLYDNVSASGVKIGTLTNPAVLLQTQVQFRYNVLFSNGLTIVTSASDDLTICYI